MSGRYSPMVVVRSGCTVGEGPLFDPLTATLFWVDIPAGRLWRWTEAAGAQAWEIGEPLGCAALVEGGGWLLATRSGIRAAAAWAASSTLWHPLEPDRPTQCNDGKCDPGGRLVVGTADAGRGEPGALYRVDAAGAPERLVSGLQMSNGLDWSPDGSRLYHVDSLTGTVSYYAWDLGAGRPHNRSDFVTIRSSDGLPDGLCVDDEGCVWLAVWGPGEVRRYSPDGRQVDVVTVPTPNVTSCAFGGADGSRLFITTAAAGVEAPDSGGAGDVFVVDTETRGAPPTPFRPAPIPPSPLAPLAHGRRSSVDGARDGA